MRRILTLTLAMLAIATLHGQSADDACMFSQTYYQGTAKAMGMGNALGAVGGDMTAMCINPAGMGLYRSNELTFSLDLMDNYNGSTYYGTRESANKLRLSIPNVGWVGTKQRSNYRPLRFTQFGIGLTRTNDYNISTSATGLNPTSSRINNPYFLSQLNGIYHDDLPDDAWAMWQDYLIDDHYSAADGYTYTSTVPEDHVWQSRKSNFKGRSEEWAFAGSANYYDRLFVGMSVNLTHIKREGTSSFGESPTSGTDTNFEQWNSEEEISSHAIGVNGKIGFIYRLNEWLRLGGAFHSPSYYAFDESRQTTTESRFVTSGFHSYTSPESNYEYIFISPLKWVGSLAFVIGEQGMVSIDAEYSNFGAARFKAKANDDYDYTPTNDAIKNSFGKTMNLRIGSEWALGNSYLRVGAAYYGSPFGLGETGGSVKKASCGVSVPVSRATTFDFAYELAYGQSYFKLYDAGERDPETVTQRQFKNILAVTLKVKF